jgi:hypothetical protein
MLDGVGEACCSWSSTMTTQSGPPFGLCRLCLTPAVLRDSHIMPRWTYRRVIQTGSGDPNPIIVRNDDARRGGRQFTEYLLCSPCEQRIGRWENYVSTVAVQNDDRFPAAEAATRIDELCLPDVTVVDLSALDVAAIVRFGSSVIWRASVSREFDRVQLGERYEPLVRRYLLDDSATFPHFAKLHVELIRPERLRIDRVVIGPYSSKWEGCHIHRFALFGFRFHVFVGGLVPDYFSELCAARTARGTLTDGSSLLPDMARMFERVRANGRIGGRTRRRR